MWNSGMKIFQLSNRGNVMHSSWKSNFKMIPNFFLSLVCSETNRKPANYCLITLKEMFPKIISMMFLRVSLKLNQTLLGRNRDVKSLAKRFFWGGGFGSGVTSTNRRDDWHRLADRGTSLSQPTHVWDCRREEDGAGTSGERSILLEEKKEWIRIKAKVGNHLTFGPC